MQGEPSMDRQQLRQALKEAASRQDAAAALSWARQLLDMTSYAPAETMFCAARLSSMASAFCERGAKSLKTYIVRSVTLEPVLPYLTTEAVFANYVLEVELGGYGSYADELLNPQSALAKFQPDLVLVVLDVDELAGRLPELCAAGNDSAVEAELEDCIARAEQLLRGFRAHHSARLLVQGLVVPDFTSLGDVGDANLASSLPRAIQRLNQALANICSSVADCVFFDVDRIAARHGRKNWRDARMYLASRLPMAAENFRTFAAGLVRSFSTLYRAPKKVLCTDLDNTLWGGILGEDGIAGIQTGTAFPGNCFLEYQRYLKQLSSRGILLAIASKNNEADVREAFAARAADLAVTLDDFVARKISWGEKADAIREIAEELSLGIDSFVFVDDNPVECEAIRRQLPGVAVVAAPFTEPWKLTEMLAEQSFFDAASVTDDDLNRVSEYKAQARRAELASSIGSRDEFLASLGIVCTFQSALDAPLARAVQLLAKTNQFNLTTRRRSAAEVEEFAAAPAGQALVVRVRDRFGDAGVVGLALANNHGKDCRIDSLLLSCRVIGRGIETAMLARIAEVAKQKGAERLLGEFIPTKKNAPCADFYTEHGFAPCAAPADGEAGSSFYELDLTTAAPATPPWITLEGTESNELSASAVLSS